MSEGTHARDTQFHGFAKALWDELVRANGYGYIDVNKWDDDGIDPTNYIQVIARRAYDLVKHTLEHAEAIAFDRLSIGEHAEQYIPDLTELPKEQE